MNMRDHPDYVHGYGPVHLRGHIVSRRHLNDPSWPREDYQKLCNTRRLHDEGKVTMCQKRDGDWIIQYAIPNHPPVKRRPYFYSETRY